MARAIFSWPMAEAFSASHPKANSDGAQGLSAFTGFRECGISTAMGSLKFLRVTGGKLLSSQRKQENFCFAIQSGRLFRMVLMRGCFRCILFLRTTPLPPPCKGGGD